MQARLNGAMGPGYRIVSPLRMGALTSVASLMLVLAGGTMTGCDGGRWHGGDPPPALRSAPRSARSAEWLPKEWGATWLFGMPVPGSGPDDVNARPYILVPRHLLHAFTEALAKGRFARLRDLSDWVQREGSTGENEEAALVAFGSLSYSPAGWAPADATERNIDQRLLHRRTVYVSVALVRQNEDGDRLRFIPLPSEDAQTLARHQAAHRILMSSPFPLLPERSGRPEVVVSQDLRRDLVLGDTLFTEIGVSSSFPAQLYAFSKGIGLVSDYLREEKLSEPFDDPGPLVDYHEQGRPDFPGYVQIFRLVYYRFPEPPAAEWVNTRWLHLAEDGTIHFGNEGE